MRMVQGLGCVVLVSCILSASAIQFTRDPIKEAKLMRKEQTQIKSQKATIRERGDQEATIRERGDQDQSPLGGGPANYATGSTSGTDDGPVLQSIVFGGAEHGDTEYTAAYDGRRKDMARPEDGKVMQCLNGVCTECADKSICWQATDDEYAIPIYEVHVPGGSASDSYRLDLWTLCTKGEGEWTIRPKMLLVNGVAVFKELVNGRLRVIVNGVEVPPTYPDSNVGAEGNTMNSLWDTLPIPSSGSARVLIDFIPIDPTQASSASIRVKVVDVDEWTNTCMSTKNCLDVLSGDNSAVGQELRGNNQKQLTCLRDGADAMDASLRTRCQAWITCLTNSQSKDRLLAILQAALGTAALNQTGVLITADGTMTKAAVSNKDLSCVDPAVDDPESWDCDCLEKMQTSCTTDYSSMTLANCFNMHYCAATQVCSAWKTANCATVLEESAMLEAKMLEARRAKASLKPTISGKGLDESLGDKTC